MGLSSVGADARSCFQRMFSSHRAAMLLIDAESGAIVDANASAEAFYGWSRDELVAMPIWNLNAEGELVARANMRGSIDAGSVHFESRHRVHDGSTRQVAVLSGPVTMDDRDDPLLLAVISDMTSQMKAIEQLAQSESRYRLLVEASPVAVYVDRAGVFAFLNPAALALFGADRQEQLIGTSLIDRVHPDFRDLVAARINALGNGVEAPVLSEEYLRLDGTPVAVEVCAKPIIYEGLPAAQVIAYDISDRKAAENAWSWLGAIVRSADEAIIGETVDGTITSWNAAAERIYGYAADEIVGRSFEVLAPGGCDEATQDACGHVCATGQVQRLTVKRQHKSGEIIDVALTLSPIRHTDGTLVGVSAMARDVTEDKRVARELEFRSYLLDHAGDWIFVFDRDSWQLLYVNEAACDALGYSGEELKEASLRDLIDPTGLPVDDALHSAGETLFEVDVRSKNGVTIRVEVRLQEMQSWDREVAVAFARDVTERDEAQAEIARMAFHDQHTGLANRVLFNDRLETSLRTRKRSRDTLAVLFLDLDHFKDINDAFGHDVGDHVLNEVASRLRTQVREADTIARLGGDEFTVLLRGFRQADDAVVVAHKLQEGLSAPMSHDGREIYVTASIGIALATDFDETAGELLRKADSAMYRAKENGRNSIHFYDPEMNAAVIERIALESDLRHALENGELSLVYQPQVSLSDGRVSRVEALMRWNHPVHGDVPPDVFIPIAEHSGLIDKIGEWALREACRQNRVWIDEGLRPVIMAVNASHRQFVHGDLSVAVAAALEWSDLAGPWLEIEITESVAMEHAERTLEAFGRLRDLGVRVAIDDFGTGYSSLSHLKRFPIQTIKVDRSFIRDVCSDEHAAAIVRTIVALAHNLGLAVVAEGVETRDQLDFLRAEDCDIIQGFLFSRALPPDALADVLKLGTRLEPEPPSTARDERSSR